MRIFAIKIGMVAGPIVFFRRNQDRKSPSMHGLILVPCERLRDVVSILRRQDSFHQFRRSLHSWHPSTSLHEGTLEGYPIDIITNQVY